VVSFDKGARAEEEREKRRKNMAGMAMHMHARVGFLGWLCWCRERGDRGTK
jgi:hypothetical protein